MTIPIETWVLPRPRKPYYPGSFPLFFEQKLWKLLGSPKKVLHPFGGFAEIGDKVDLNPETNPTWIGDAHKMDFILDNTYDLVICDPPYNDKLSEEMYNTPKLHYKTWVKEAVRVCKHGGYIASYNWIWTTKPPNTDYFKIIVVLLGQQHRARICCVYQKNKLFKSLFEVKNEYSPNRTLKDLENENEENQGVFIRNLVSNGNGNVVLESLRP